MAVEWIKVGVETTREGLEIVTGVLMDHGIAGCEIIDDEGMKEFLRSEKGNWDYVNEDLLAKESGPARVLFYVGSDARGRGAVKKIEKALSHIKNGSVIDVGSLSVATEKTDDSVWLNEWKKYYKPFRIGGKTVVCPEWEEVPEALLTGDGDRVFKIDPGQAFGTGLHQSTRLCVCALEEYARPGLSLLDIGCGSGILGIIAVLHGAGSCAACDIDPNAGRAALVNAKLNDIGEDKYSYCHGDPIRDAGLYKKISKTVYDIILANITADVVIKLCGIVRGLLSDGGVFICSGIIGERLEETEAALRLAGLGIISRAEEENWHCLVARA